MSRSGWYEKQPADYQAFMPSLLPLALPLQRSADTETLLVRANKSLLQLDALGASLPNRALFTSMYVRKEALLSSQIEGTQATFEDILTFETYRDLENFDDVEEVVNYVQALSYGIQRLQSFPMSVRVIKELHAILMKGVRGATKTPGEFRRSQNWIGPPGGGLKQARYVPPPADRVPDLIGNLEQFMHGGDSENALIDCALLHYQFETIHPFLDGNGRVGRLLIPIYLSWKGVLSYPLLYLSLFLKVHRQEYFDRLTYVRERGNYEQWVDFFLEGVAWSAENGVTTIQKILALKERLVARIQDESRCSLQSLKMLDHLFQSPLGSIGHFAQRLNVSRQWATTQVNLFEELGILKEVTGHRRNKRYLFFDYLAILDDSRSVP